MTDDTETKPKSAAQVLLDAAAEHDREMRRQLKESVTQFFDDEKFKGIPADFLSVAKQAMRSKARFDPKSKLLVIGKKGRSPQEWTEKKFPSLLQQAEKPRGDVELEAAKQACQSLKMQAELVKSIGAERAGDLMALYGGKVGSLTTPKPISDSKKTNTVALGDNPWRAENWNVTRQGAIVTALGLGKAEQIAAAANSHVGATKPTKVSP